MKGTGFEYAVGIIIIVAVITVGVIFLMIGTSVNQAKTIQTDVAFNAVDSSYIIKSCLEQDGQITKSYLDANKGKHLCELCGICSVIVQATVIDMNNEKSWEFEYGTLTQSWEWLKDLVQIWKDSEEKRAKHSIMISIRDGPETHIGRLDVQA